MKRVAALFVGIFLAMPVANAADAVRVHVRVDRVHAGLTTFTRHDYVKAYRLLRPPAETGNAAAQGVLCFLYTEGYGVPRSWQEAAFWCERAAEQGNVQAQYMFGLLYNKGHGVPENYILAYKWLNLAASRASGPKKEYSFRMRNNNSPYKMSPGQIERAQALSLAWRPEPGSASRLTTGCARVPGWDGAGAAPGRGRLRI